MRLEAKGWRHRKGEPHRHLHEHASRVDLRAESLADAAVLAKLYVLFVKVGAGGLNYCLDQAHAEIAEIEAECEDSPDAR